MSLKCFPLFPPGVLLKRSEILTELLKCIEVLPCVFVLATPIVWRALCLVDSVASTRGQRLRLFSLQNGLKFATRLTTASHPGHRNVRVDFSTLEPTHSRLISS